MGANFDSVDIQKRVLGLMIADAPNHNAVLDKQLAGVSADLFTDSYSDVFTAAQALHARGIAADRTTIHDELGRTGNSAWIEPSHIDAMLYYVLQNPMPLQDQLAMLPEYVKLLQEHRKQQEQQQQQDKSYDVLADAVLSRIPFDQLASLAQSFQEAHADGAKRPHYQFLTVAQLRERPKPELLIDQILPAEGTSVTHGDSGKGKTQVMLDMAAHVTLGKPWRGFKVKQGPVWWVAAEGATTTYLNIEAWMIRHGVEDLLDLLVYDQPINLCEPGEVANLVADIERAERKPVLVVVDTLSQTSIGFSDSDNSDMAVYGDSLRRIARACGGQANTIHHNGRNGELRGASTIQANTDTAIEVGGDAKNSAGIITCKKQRGGWDFFKQLSFRIIQQELGDAYGSFTGAVAEDAGTPKPKLEPLTPLQQQALDTLVAVYPNWLRFNEWEKESSVGKSTLSTTKTLLDQRGLLSVDSTHPRKKKYRASRKAVIRHQARIQAAGSVAPLHSISTPIGADEPAA